MLMMHTQTLNHTTMDLPIHSLNTKLIAFLEKKNVSLGLADGKMGVTYPVNQ